VLIKEMATETFEEHFQKKAKFFGSRELLCG